MKHLSNLFIITCIIAACNEPTSQPTKNSTDESAAKESSTTSTTTTSSTSTTSSSANYKEGRDYLVYERVRLLDKVGFTEPQEAYSMLMPQGWQHEDAVTWNPPGSTCAGTTSWLKAHSADNKYELELLPPIVYTWPPSPVQAPEPTDGSECHQVREPIEAEAYLPEIFSSQLGNPQVLEVTPNSFVVEEMSRNNDATIREMQQYGAGAMHFRQSAINAHVKWKEGREGLITLGVSTMEGEVPNPYDGSSSTIYTTSVTKRTIFKFPANEIESARQQFSVIMASVHTNPAWSDAVNQFWKQARQQSNIAHVGRIRMTDEQTRRMGEKAIEQGNQRLKTMDNDMRNWEARQSSQDRMHTEFIKTIRGVENYRDAEGKFEMTAGYDHAWSRGDGSSFILSNNPNFDPSSVFQDQQWKQMQKVD